MTTVKPLRHVVLIALLAATSLCAQQTPHTSEQVTVTAYGTPLTADQSAASTIVLTPEEMQQSPAHTFGDMLRQIPGVEFYRRTGTLIANPTSEGISLRGLGGSSVSRTLVLSDHIPLNDAFGGWVHWEELPALSISSVEVVRGGASDLYGSSAVGGVVNVLRDSPHGRFLHLNAEGGSQKTQNVGGIAGFSNKLWENSLAGSFIRTDGYITVAPNARGPIDTAYNASIANGGFFFARKFSSSMVFARFNLYNDNRGNGTPLATNADRIARYALGDDTDLPHAQHVTLRLYGSVNHYRQSFSSVNGPRTSESLTRLLRTPSQELGAVAQYSVSTHNLLLFGGADVHDVRATDLEIPISGGASHGVFNVSVRQRATGVYGESLWNSGRFTLSAGGRIDVFQNLDTHEITNSGSGADVHTTLPNRTEVVANPRLGAVYRVHPGIALTATGFRAFRAATPYELFRTGQVGSIMTIANPSLISERATGWESGVQLGGHNTVARISYFWEAVNRPITSPTIGPNLKQRQNLGQIRSNGITVDAEWHPKRWMKLIGGYQFANATVTRNSTAPSLIGNWIPEVAHNTGSAELLFAHPRIGSLSLLARGSGRSFDDDENTQLIRGYTRVDAHAERSLAGHAPSWRSHAVFYADGENLFDRTIEAGRVPQLTLANRRTLTVGLRYNLNH